MSAPPRAASGAPYTPPDAPPDGFAALEALFDGALEVPSGERAAWLAARCADAALRGEVEALLAAHERTAGVLDRPPVPPAPADALAPGQRVGPYRVVRELGRGGMGVVYLAERGDGQFERRVAVKVLRAGADTDALRRRFAAERRILAALSHPHIAQLLDGGVTDDGRPYLVIEHVDGLPVTAYCDGAGLDVAARLRLFLDVCAAVQHAHQRLVLHRDLKPGNVFVARDGRAKLLDFGIAKLLDGSPISGGDAAAPSLTRAAQRPMTPAYASPEQVRGDALTTASDVYALGLLLYELLAGVPAQRVAGDAPHAVYEAVCVREPARPSDGALRDAPPGAPGPAGAAAAHTAAATSTPLSPWRCARRRGAATARPRCSPPTWRATSTAGRWPPAAAARPTARASCCGATAPRRPAPRWCCSPWPAAAGRPRGRPASRRGSATGRRPRWRAPRGRAARPRRWPRSSSSCSARATRRRGAPTR